MNDEKEIFLPDTTVKYGTLKKKLSENYDLVLIDKTKRNLYLGITVLLGIGLIVSLVNNKK